MGKRVTNFKRSRVNLAQRRLGAEVVFATDDFFAAKERLIDDPEPIFVPDKFDDHGKWMDGWESRRRRGGGHDYCVLSLGPEPGLVESIVIDTSHFTGNFPPEASLEAVCSLDDVSVSNAQWRPLTQKMLLEGDSRVTVKIHDQGPWTHIKLNIFPDGGVARLRVYGRRSVDWAKKDASVAIDLAAIENGAVAIACNDEHFGVLSNLISPGKGINMGDGWETRRRREQGHDWCIIELGHSGVVEKILIDTAFFKGNYPERCSIQGASVSSLDVSGLEADSSAWPEILSSQQMSADSEHWFVDEINKHESITHVRLNLFPDGGVSRLRLFGRITK
ncbi:MAG: allantoicase [Pseudomonadota bacterium]